MGTSTALRVSRIVSRAPLAYDALGLHRASHAALPRRPCARDTTAFFSSCERVTLSRRPVPSLTHHSSCSPFPTPALARISVGCVPQRVRALHAVLPAASESAQWATEVGQVQRFMDDDRFAFTKRPYTAEDVVKLRGNLPSVPRSDFTARKLYALCRERFAQKRFTHTFGCLDPVQVRHRDCLPLLLSVCTSAWLWVAWSASSDAWPAIAYVCAVCLPFLTSSRPCRLRPLLPLSPHRWPRWPSTWTPSTSAGGSAPPPPPQPTSRAPTLPITPRTPSPIRSTSSSAPSSSRTAASAPSASR